MVTIRMSLDKKGKQNMVCLPNTIWHLNGIKDRCVLQHDDLESVFLRDKTHSYKRPPPTTDCMIPEHGASRVLCKYKRGEQSFSVCGREEFL